MPANHVLLESIKLTQTATSVTFDNLPPTGYTDLKVVFSIRTDAAAVNENVMIAFNGSTANFTARWMFGDGAGLGHSTTARIAGFGNANNATSTIYGSSSIYIQKYTSSAPKLYSSDAVLETNAQTAYQGYIAGLWSNNAAITSITLTPQVGPNFLANCTFSLYGIAALGTTPAIAPLATGGNIIANDGTYWYHAFLSSGTFTPTKDLTSDYVVIAGGGGGARYTPSGGGAGGLRSTVTQTGGNSAGVNLETPLSLTSGTLYRVLIGAGGAGATSNNMGGQDGSATSFAGLVSCVGGGGGINESTGPARSGGSGGGGARSWNAAGAGTANQGFAGGTGTSAPQFSGGGGGGAGAVGVNATTGGGGNGGAGVLLSAFATPTNTGVSGYYAGGGAGASYAGTAATGGVGGGGNGGINPTAGTSGIANTGGGGGGSGADGGGVTSNAGGSGASGIVIIRYAMV
jgi:hypothetical protein